MCDSLSTFTVKRRKGIIKGAINMWFLPKWNTQGVPIDYEKMNNKQMGVVLKDLKQRHNLGWSQINRMYDFADVARLD